MLIAPVAGFRLIPLGQLPLCATVAFPLSPSVAGAPLMVSLAATLLIGMLAVPETPLPLSVTGRIATPTVMVRVAVSTLPRLSLMA